MVPHAAPAGPEDAVRRAGGEGRCPAAADPGSLRKVPAVEPGAGEAEAVAEDERPAAPGRPRPGAEEAGVPGAAERPARAVPRLRKRLPAGRQVEAQALPAAAAVSGLAPPDHDARN